nr:MAG TPA: hypothetical protein [Caudoviricetes sp.]DAX89791.1 MAG TPA: hypothetical protein [Caudoviricetes sp.]
MFSSNKLRNKLCRYGNKLGFLGTSSERCSGTRIVENLLVPELVPELVAGKNR